MTNPITADLEALRAHDEERAKIIRRIENAQLEPLRQAIAAFDTPANRKAIELAQTLTPLLTDARQGQIVSISSGLQYAIEYLKGEAARISAQIEADASAAAAETD